MKKITLIVPDKLIHVLGTSSFSQSTEIEVDRESIQRALEVNDYHDNYYFPNGTVTVQSIVSYKN